MKIVHIIPRLVSGGAERFVISLCNRQAENNEVCLLVLFPVDEQHFCRQLLSDKVRLISLHKKSGLSLNACKSANQWIRKIAPDVVHSHIFAFNYILLPALTYRKPLYIHTVHNDACKEAPTKLLRSLRYLFFHTRLIKPVCISNASLKSFEAYYGMSAPMIWNGCEQLEITNDQQEVRTALDKFRQGVSGKIIVNVAHLRPQKNQLSLAEAVKELVDEGYPLSLLIVGQKATPSIVAAIEALHSPAIHLLGEQKNVGDLLANADAFCLASLYEGLPISLLEAFSAGCIPLCTPVGGVADLITDGFNGLTAEDTSKEGIKTMLKRFISLPDEKIRQLKTNARQSYDGFSMKRCCEQYIALYRQ